MDNFTIRQLGRWAAALFFTGACLVHGPLAAQSATTPGSGPAPVVDAPPAVLPQTLPPAPSGSEAPPVAAEPVVPDAAQFTGTAVEPGTKGPVVVALQKALADAGFYRGVLDGSYGPRTQQAVIALHKALGTRRIAAWQAEDWEKIRAYQGPVLPKRNSEPDRVEIDLTRQLLYFIKRDKVTAIIPVSTGNGKPYESFSGKQYPARTPVGRFVFYYHHQGWRTSYLGKLYQPWYFRGGYALHGSGSVPPQPASHGCARIPLWEADYLSNGRLAIGMPIYLWRKPTG